MPAACGQAEVIDWAPTFADLVWAPAPLGRGHAHTLLHHTDERYGVWTIIIEIGCGVAQYGAAWLSRVRRGSVGCGVVQ